MFIHIMYVRFYLYCGTSSSSYLFIILSNFHYYYVNCCIELSIGCCDAQYSPLGDEQNTFLMIRFNVGALNNTFVSNVCFVFVM